MIHEYLSTNTTNTSDSNSAFLRVWKGARIGHLANGLSGRSNCGMRESEVEPKIC